MNALPRGARAFSASAKSSGPLGTLYRTVFQRSSSYAAFVLVGAIVVDTVYSGFANSLWEAANRGVRCRSPVALLSAHCEACSRRLWHSRDAAHCTSALL